MMMKTIIARAALAVGAAAMITGCACDPIGEIAQTDYRTTPNLNGGCNVQERTVAVDAVPQRQLSYRPYSIQPVGERVIATPGDSYRLFDGQLRDPLSPYGPTNSCGPSLWW